MKLLSIVVLSFFLLQTVLEETPALGSSSEESDRAPSIYDPNPKHIWNRLYDALLIRRDQTGVAYGVDALEPLLWRQTEYLLSGSSYQRALSILEKFLGTQGENRIRDPVRKALLQHNLWAVFDWSALSDGHHVGERRELQIRLAEVLRRLALTASEIKSLPDNYAQAVCLGSICHGVRPHESGSCVSPLICFNRTDHGSA